MPFEEMQPTQPVENRLSLKVKIGLVAGGVLVIAGSALAGYFFAQKKLAVAPPVNNIQPSDQQNVDNLPVTADPVIPYPTETTPPEEQYSFATTTLPQEIADKIVWSEPKQIESLNWFKDDLSPPDTGGIESYGVTKYYEVGRFGYNGENGRVLVVKKPPQDMGDIETFRAIEFRGEFIILHKYQEHLGGGNDFNPEDAQYYTYKLAPEFREKIKFDEHFNVDLLNFPKILTGPKNRQILHFAGIYSIDFYLGQNTVDTKYVKSFGKPVFVDPKFGQVYTLDSKGGFYVFGTKDTFAVYKLEPDFFNKDSSLAQIVWNEGSWNGYEYSYGDRGGCGAINYISVITSSVTIATDLEVVGKTSKGDNIYELKNKDHSLLRNFYDNGYFPDQNGNKVSYEEFIDLKPLVFWIDPFGRLIKLQNMRFVPQAECGKPVIYLYPEKTTDVSVQIEPKGGMTYSDPYYNGGWKVRAKANGELTELKSDKQYPYLFWEGRGGLYQTPEKGFVFKREDLAVEMPQKLVTLGMNGKEITDFMEFWLPRMQAKPYYFVTFLGTQQMNQLAPLTISPKPDTVVRILMDFTPLDKPVDVLPLSLGRTPERKGFTVIEWGGVLR